MNSYACYEVRASWAQTATLLALFFPVHAVWLQLPLFGMPTYCPSSIALRFLCSCVVHASLLTTGSTRVQATTLCSLQLSEANCTPGVGTHQASVLRLLCGSCFCTVPVVNWLQAHRVCVSIIAALACCAAGSALHAVSHAMPHPMHIVAGGSACHMCIC
jgi:hypothetical protein